MSERRPRYHVAPDNEPWTTRGAVYRCPCCGDLQPCYQLKPDINGIMRRTDVTGVPCRECLRGLGLLELTDE